jgi:predicted membrane chloride channel (bestrophin family)
MNLIKETMSWFQMALQLKGSVAIKVLPRAFVCSLFGLVISLIYYSKLPFPWHNLGTITTNVVFSYDPNDIPLDQICRTIQSNMEDIIGLSDSHYPENELENLV